MRFLGVVILGGVGAIFLGLFAVSWMAEAWQAMAVTGGTAAVLAGAIILWLGPDDPGASAPTDASRTWEPLLPNIPQALHRSDGADHGGSGDATPAGDSGDSPGDGGGSSD